MRTRQRLGIVTATDAPEALEAKVALASSNLALRCGGEAFDLRPAPSARVNVALPYDAPLEVRELQIELPFAHRSGCASWSAWPA